METGRSSSSGHRPIRQIAILIPVRISMTATDGQRRWKRSFPRCSSHDPDIPSTNPPYDAHQDPSGTLGHGDLDPKKTN